MFPELAIRVSANMSLKSYLLPRSHRWNVVHLVALASAVSAFTCNFCGSALAAAAGAIPVPDKVALAVADRQDFQSPDRVHFEGLLGLRMDANTTNRLAVMDTARLLEGYRKRPGRQAWDGEHVGKWLHAATLAWVYSGNPALRAKMDDAVAELMKCQLADGYLGTYLDKDRWTEWDVWAHKYNLIGLITYMRYTGNLAPLPTCRKMADLLCDTFGDEPGKRDIIKAGYHMGMAPTSVLEPMVLLYRMTGEQRYLDFCKYILRSWEQPNGAKILSTLLDVKRVDKVGNGKAYEMLSCLNGALEYYRTVGDPKILQACLNAWDDIVRHRLYLTGTASYNELFHDDFDMPNVANVGETCVTVTWIQFNAQLLRLTGQARFADQLERAVLNQLFGAQRCDGAAWGYYVQMEGTKPYSGTLDGHCCLSSGPRGVALIPTFAVTTDADGVVLNLFETGVAQLALRDGTPITVRTRTAYPDDGHIAAEISLPMPKVFMVKVRIPAWCPKAEIKVNGKVVTPVPGTDGYAAVNREWKMGDKIDVNLALEPRVVLGDHKNLGKVAVLYGPLVLAADEAALKAARADVSFNSVGARGTTPDSLKVTPGEAPAALKTWPGAQVYQINGIARSKTAGTRPAGAVPVDLVPFSEAGQSGSRYKVWLPLTVAPRTDNVLQDGDESRSRHGNILGSIVDGDPRSYVVTFNGGAQLEDWFAVTLDEPAAVGRVVFAHGAAFHDGGWFDASAGKPRVQVKGAKDDSWQTVGELMEYPATTAVDSAGLTNGQRFTLVLPAPAQVTAVRVLGKPAGGDNAKQAFSSCAELQAFEH
jgi:DUF1680 family protein